MTVEEIIKRKEELINIKKSATKYSDVCKMLPIKDDSEGVLKLDVDLGSDLAQDMVKVIANTYYWLDSHGDVHVKGCFTKSISEQLPAGKIFHFDNHEHSFAAKVGNVENTEERKVKWSDLGVTKEGTTICVVGTTKLVSDYNKQVFDAYKSGQIDQHSVGMQYVNLALAVNNPSEEEEYKLWQAVYPLLGNPEKADGQGYFWVIKEAKLKEYSCVLWQGSNSLTPTSKDLDPSNDDNQNTEEPVTEPLKDTQEAQKQFFINLLNTNK